MLFYSHLTLDMRREFEWLHRCGTSQAEIARRLNVSRSTVSRELKRNGVAGTYDAEWAHEQAMNRKQRPDGVLPTYPLVIDVAVTRLMTEKKFPCSAQPSFLTLFEDKRLPVSQFTFPIFLWQEPKVRKPLTEEQKENRSFYLKLRDRDHIIEYLLRSEFRYYVNSRLYDSQRKALITSTENKSSGTKYESKSRPDNKRRTPGKKIFQLKRRRLNTLHHGQSASGHQTYSLSFEKWKPPP